jgi:hypothetical protein
VILLTFYVWVGLSFLLSVRAHTLAFEVNPKFPARPSFILGPIFSVGLFIAISYALIGLASKSTAEEVFTTCLLIFICGGVAVFFSSAWVVPYVSKATFTTYDTMEKCAKAAKRHSEQ